MLPSRSSAIRSGSIRRSSGGRFLRKMGYLLGCKPSEARFQKYQTDLIAMKGHNTLALLEWLVGGVLDEWLHGDPDVAQTMLMLAFVSIDQSVVDSGRWHNTMLFTGAREIPWGHILRERVKVEGDKDQKYSQLADPAWVAAIAGYKKDQEALGKRLGKN